MEMKTKVAAEEGRSDLFIVREFELPVSALFEAYTDAEVFAQWMGTRVITYDCRTNGAWRIETSDAQGKVAFTAHGTFHDVRPDEQIIRTFEMNGAPFGVQLELLDFASLDEEKSRLTVHILYESSEQRDRMLSFGMGKGMSMAHDRMESIQQQRRKQR